MISTPLPFNWLTQKTGSRSFFFSRRGVFHRVLSSPVGPIQHNAVVVVNSLEPIESATYLVSTNQGPYEMPISYNDDDSNNKNNNINKERHPSHQVCAIAADALLIWSN